MIQQVKASYNVVVQKNDSEFIIRTISRVLFLILAVFFIISLSGCSKVGLLPSHISINKYETICKDSTKSGCDNNLFAKNDYLIEPYSYYSGLRVSTFELLEKYDNRANRNRNTIYIGAATTLLLGTAASAYTVFNAATTAAAKSLPLASTLIGGWFGMVDNQMLASAYTKEANSLREALVKHDKLFVKETTKAAKAELISSLYGEVMASISRLELQRNGIIGNESTLLDRANKLRDKLEVSASIKPYIELISPVVASSNEDRYVTIHGSGFGNDGKVFSNGTKMESVVISENMLFVKIPKNTSLTSGSVKEYRFYVTNKYAKSSQPSTTYISGDPYVEETAITDGYTAIEIKGVAIPENISQFRCGGKNPTTHKGKLTWFGHYKLSYKFKTAPDCLKKKLTIPCKITNKSLVCR